MGRGPTRKKTSTAKTRKTKAGKAKTAKAKTRKAKTTKAKTGASKARTAKTSTAKARKVKASTAKTRATKTRKSGTSAAKTRTAKAGNTKTGTAKAAAAKTRAATPETARVPTKPEAAETRVVQPSVTKPRRSVANGVRRPSSTSLEFDDHSLGHDEIRAHGERRGVPGETIRTQGVVESFELMDPVKRAAYMRAGSGKKH